MSEPDPKEAKYSTAMTSGTSASGKPDDSADKLPQTSKLPEATGGQVPTLEVLVDQDPKEPNITFDTTLEELSSHCKLLATAGIESSSSSEHISPGHPHLTKIPHPRSNYKHIDPPPANNVALQKLPPHEREAYERLQLAFDWLICRTYPLLEAVNLAIKHDNVNEYISARNAYLEFTNNLANRDPGPNDIDPIKGFGYGRNFKQTSIVFLIGPDETTGQNVIKGARIQAEWNPHVSSSGVPIKH